MLQFKYRLTDPEFATSLRLNQTRSPLQWKVFLLVILCMLPSLVFFYFLEAGWSMAWFGIMIGVLSVYSISAFFKKTGQAESYDQEVTFYETHIDQRFAHSRSQLKWGKLDDIEETADSFRFQRLQRYSYYPKRVFGNQLDQCREFFNRVKSTPPAEVPAVELFRQIYESESQFPTYDFKYVPEDMEMAIKSNFQVAQDLEQEEASPNSQSSWSVVIFIAILVGLLSWLTFDWENQSPIYYLALLGAWLLPIGLMLGYIKLLKLRSRIRSRVPEDICKLRLTQSGWAIGNEDGVVEFDWRDVSEIYDSKHFYGFKTVDLLLHLVPKRVFPDDVTKTRFLSQSLEMHRQSKLKKDVVVATAVETGNPYQSPLQGN